MFSEKTLLRSAKNSLEKYLWEDLFLLHAQNLTIPVCKGRCLSGYAGVDKFLSRGQTFWARYFTCAVKMGGQSQSVRPIETQLETLLFVPYHLNRTCSFHFKCVSIKSFCNEAFTV